MAFGAREKRRSPDILIVPLIDILLVILIFLLVTTSFRQFPTVEINLPRAENSAEKERPEVVILTVTTSPPAVFVNQQPTDLDELKFIFEDIARKNPDTRIALNADKNAPFGIVMRIWQEIKAAGLTKIQTLTQEGVISPQ